ncbi:MAG: hypothetical protein IPL21_05115 [Saprospirales bacterium]|nr:hypothetical protein [Saprospirales bacterium]
MSTEQLLQEKKSILHQLESSNDNELLHEIYLLLESRNTQLENPFSQDELELSKRFKMKYYSAKKTKNG